MDPAIRRGGGDGEGGGIGGSGGKAVDTPQLIRSLWPLHFPDDECEDSPTENNGRNDGHLSMISSLVNIFAKVSRKGKELVISEPPSSSESLSSSGTYELQNLLQLSRRSIIESLSADSVKAERIDSLSGDSIASDNFFAGESGSSENNPSQPLSGGPSKKFRVLFCHTSLCTLLNASGDNQRFELFLYHQPKVALACLGIAVGVLRKEPDALFTVRMFNLLPKYVVGMRDIVTATKGKFLSLRCHALKVSPKKLMVTESQFSCNRCEQDIKWKFADGVYTEPTKCPGKDCRSRKFELLRSESKYIDNQRITLQEMEQDNLDAGRVPRQLHCEVMGDLVDSCKSGDTVIVSGVIRSVNSNHFAGRGGKSSVKNALSIIYIEANHVANVSGGSLSKRGGGGGQDDKFDGEKFSYDKLKFINRLANADPGVGFPESREAFPFDMLVRSFCPEIYGHELVKCGLLLSLLAGTEADSNARETITVRSNIHVLVVGDPGMGKSCLLRRVNELSPRSVFIGGNTSTTTGITASVSKEGKNGDVNLEAGAVVLADGGTCCIDEFDKCHPSNHDGLLEAMEQQSISIAKSGVCASMSARCSVVAAANPKGGHYSRNKSVSENIAMKGPILSRFDLVFVLVDNADGDQDARLADHIFNAHVHAADGVGTVDNHPSDPKSRKRQKPNDRLAAAWADSQIDMLGSSQCSFLPTQSTRGGEVLLAETEKTNVVRRIQKVVETQKNSIPQEMLKAYIQYARDYCHPKMSKKAAKVIMDFYLQLRGQMSSSSGVPITTRQLESMIRLCQARAKACMRGWVTKEDASDIVEIMKLSIYQVNITEEGFLDSSRGGAGGRSKNKQKSKVIDAMKSLKRRGFDRVSLADLKAETLQTSGLSHFDDFEECLDELREVGELVKQKDERGKNVYRLPSY